MALDTAFLAEVTEYLAALEARAGRLEVPRDRPRPVLLPSYRGTRGQPNLTALIALLLQRYGVPVLVHGVVQPAEPEQPSPAPANVGSETTSSGSARIVSDPTRMLSADVLWELGIEPVTRRDEVRERLLHDGIALAPVDVLAPGLASFVAKREGAAAPALLPVVGALLDPFGGEGFRVIGVADEATLSVVRAHLGATRGDALLFCGTDGEPFADPRRQPRIEHVAAGAPTICVDAEADDEARAPSLARAADAAATAAWITQALSGSVPLPPPIVAQLACCLNGARRVTAAA